jgi:hypothetical protein
VRPAQLVAGAALTAALAMVALPGIAGSRSPSSVNPVDPAAFQPLQVTANAVERPIPIGPLDPSFASAGRVDASSEFVEPGAEPQRVVGRPAVRVPAARGGTAQKPPRYKVSGVATFYGAGTTAMRLPRGTTIVVCGDGGCIERVVTDYGPAAGTDRIIDLYTPDFFEVCGCPSWSGETNVTVSVY